MDHPAAAVLINDPEGNENDMVCVTCQETARAVLG